MAATVEIYTKFTCPYCSRAKRLLDSKGVKYQEYDISMDRQKRDEMTARVPGSRTVPQILIDNVPIGGSDDLVALQDLGKLDILLAGKGAR